MKYRMLGNTGMKISEVSFGSWAIGGTWGQVDDKVSMAALEAALEGGINFFDTADVYGDGRSERLLGKLKKSHPNQIYIGTKAGRKINPHVAKGYTIEAITGYVENSLKNLDVECLDLLQMHCPPSQVYDNGEFFDDLNTLVKAGKVSLQSTFEADDHRAFNRNGEAFDKGETFSGVPFDKGLLAVEELMKIKPENITMAQFALAWILQYDAISCVIPGGKTPSQVNQNIASSGVELASSIMKQVGVIYESLIKADVHHLW